MKKDDKIINLIDIMTEKLLTFFKKIGKLTSNKNSHDTIKIFTKIIVALILLMVMRIPFLCLQEIGRLFVYTIGTTFRSILTGTWNYFMKISYLIFAFVILLKVINQMFYDKELNFIEQDRKKDSKVKKKIFNPIITIIKIGMIILTIILCVVALILLIMLITSIFLLMKNAGLLSIIFIILGLLIMIMSGIMLIIKIIGGSYNE